MMQQMSESMYRPLFEEPSAECERGDPWSGPKGFMFGGWFLPAGTTWEMAQQYYDAANQLVESIQRDEMEDYKLGIPVLFLYRHWLELAIKSMIHPTRGHDLIKLSASLLAHFEKRGIEVPHWVVGRIQEMAKIDPDSTAFRYAEDSIPGEIYVSLSHLKNAMKLLHVALSSASLKGMFPPESLLVAIADNPSSPVSYIGMD